MRINGLQLVTLIEQAQHLEDFERAIARSVVAQPDAGAILDFFEVPAAEAFNVPPNEAIGYFKAKGLKPTFSYADMLGAAHDQAFTVAKMMDVDLLSQVRASLDDALSKGTQFKDWAKDLIPSLQAAGWWGKKEVVDPLSGKIVTAQLGSPWRLETIFRTNMQSAYAAGQWQEIEAQADVAPFLMYDAVDDFRTREAHRAWDRKVLPVTSAWWRTHYPPNGWNCRCGVIQLSADDVKQLGLKVDAQAPDDGFYAWKNPRTGETLKVPNGIDPGFAKNGGAAYSESLQQLLNEKIAAMTSATLKRAANEAQKKMAALSALQGEAAEELIKAEQLAAQNLRALQARVTAQAKEFEAQTQIDLIAKGKEAVGGAGAQYKVKALAQLSKGDDWPELKPTEKLAAIEQQAAALKFQNEQASKLAAYKKAVIEGKTPAPNQVKAFNLLTPEDQAKLIAKIEAEKAAIAAQKAAAAEQAAAQAAQAAQAQAAPTQKVASLLSDADAPDPDNLVLVGAKTKGSNEGGIYQDQTTGVRYMVKFNGSEDNVRNEVLAGKLYQLAGIEAPELHAIRLGNRPAIASRIVDGIKEVDARTLAATESVMDGFAVDAWLSNWDAVGLSYDNIVLIGGRAMRIDVGGSLRYRAMGGLKGKAFGDVVTEVDSLRDPSLNRTSFEVFKNITKDQIEAGVVRVLRVSDDDIRATVERYGPTDDAERAALIDRLIARKRDLAKRYPDAARRAMAAGEAAEAPAPKVSRVTDTEQRFVEESRVNGYGFQTDSDQIEDHMVTVHTFKRQGGDVTRGFFKLREAPSRDLAQRVAQASGGEAPSVDVSKARESILAVVKSINFRADKGSPFDVTVETKLTAAITEARAAIAAIQKAAGKAKNAEQMAQTSALLSEWADKLEAIRPAVLARAQAAKLPGTFPAGSIPDGLELKPDDVKAGGLVWRKVTNGYTFNTSRFERSFATETENKAMVYGVQLHYETELADGTRVVYFPHDPKVAWAMQGIVKIDAPGRGVDATTRVFEAMSELGLKSERAGELDRKHLYLNAFARIRLLRGKDSARQAFEAITGNDDDALQKKLAILRAATGVDVEKSAGWRAVDGVRQAFGHGRAYQLRPDLDTPEFDQFAKEHVLFHNPQGLGSDSGSGVFERLKAVIDGGGVMASLTDRVRRGVALSGSSVAADLSSGGADYFFTRIKQRGTTGTGLYWRANAVKRMDAITYQSDQFGRTTAGHIEANRLGQDVASLRAMARSSGNETIFKVGLSVFDDLDRIVLSTKAEVDDAIAWMKSKGYTAWPDGRKLEEVIITKAQNNAKP